MCELGLKCPYFNHAIKTAQILAGNNTDTGTDEVCTNLPLCVARHDDDAHTSVKISGYRPIWTKPQACINCSHINIK
jgi:hypothetical protein